MEQELEPTVSNIVGREAQPTVITTVQQGIEPVTEALIRRVVREENQSLMERLLAGGTRNDSPEDRTFRLKFLDELPNTVLTGMKLVSKENECLKLALHDSEERIVESGPGSSAKVNVVVLEVNDNDDENNMTREIFESRIIKTGEKKKPRFPKDVHIYLKEGVGKLIDVKLGHGSDWIKKCKIRLGAKMGQNLNGVMVQEAWTPPFEVRDKRPANYKNKKHYPPFLSSEVWRLKEIGKGGKRHERLKGKGIETVSDFLFWYHVDHEGLKKILLGRGRGGKCNWEAIFDHAKKTCTNDDQRMHYDDDQRMFSHKSSIEPQTSVVYSFVGKLKGIINESEFVPNDKLPDHKKDHAYKLLSSVLEGSAFKERHNIPFNVEASLPDRSFLEVTASTNSSWQPLSEHIYQAREQGSSSQNINPNNWSDSGPPHSRVSEEMGELCNPADLGTLHEPSIASGSNSLAWNELFNSAVDEEWHNFFCFSPNPMVEYYKWNYNTQIVLDPKRWKKFSRMWFLLREWMSKHATCSSKKRKLC